MRLANTPTRLRAKPLSAKTRTQELRGQDKGHRAEIAAFGKALLNRGPAPISWDEIRAVTLASLLAVESLREEMPFAV
jgi:hypothetical protein